MEQFRFNAKAQDERVLSEVGKAITLVKDNLSQGVRVTEFYFPKDIAHKIREDIDGIIKGQPFTWMTVATGYNEFTGKPQSYCSQTIGNEKYYKLKYCGE